MKAVILFLGAAIAIGGLIVTLNSTTEAERLRAELRVMANRQAKLDAAIGTARREVAATGKAVGSAQAELRALRAEAERQAAAKAHATAVRATAQASQVEPATVVAQNPTLRGMYRQATAADTALRYLPLFHQLNLDPATQAKLLDLLTEAAQSNQDLNQLARAQGLTKQEVAKLQADANTRTRAAEAQLLGDSAYAALGQFERMKPMEGIVNDASSLVAHAGDPLSLDQATQLLKTLAEGSRQYQAGQEANVRDIDWTKALNDMQTILTPAQYTALKAEAENMRVYQLVQQFYANLKAHAAPPPNG